MTVYLPVTTGIILLLSRLGIVDLLDTDDDNDNIPDYLDDDDDGDGIPDAEEDENKNNIPDILELQMHGKFS